MAVPGGGTGEFSLRFIIYRDLQIRSIFQPTLLDLFRPSGALRGSLRASTRDQVQSTMGLSQEPTERLRAAEPRRAEASPEGASVGAPWGL